MVGNPHLAFGKRLATILALGVLFFGTGMTFSPSAYAAGIGGDRPQPNYVLCSSLTWRTVASNFATLSGVDLYVYLIAAFDHYNTGTYCDEIEAKGVVQSNTGGGIGAPGTLGVSLTEDNSGLATSIGTGTGPGPYSLTVGPESGSCGQAYSKWDLNQGGDYRDASAPAGGQYCP